MNPMTKKSDPLSVEEMQEAAEIFFPLFSIIDKRMPKSAATEDTLKVMENVAKLGHKLRADKLEDKRKERFGFNKEDSDGE
jgi:hypothetical protein|tara:strand:+ start:418 stop:660 length:243 start_codon:yes stop_codon:yes gene_type:complete